MEKYHHQELLKFKELSEIKRNLDAFFKIENFPKDLPFSVVMPEIYRKQGIDMNKYFEKLFLKRFNGLMLNNSSVIKKVFGTVFLDKNVLSKIIQKDEEDVLIFSHHPVEDETSGRGFVAMEEDHLRLMKEKKISIYSLHSPLDMNRKISTAGSIASRFSLNNISHHFEASDFEGVVGELAQPLELKEFLENTKVILNNSVVNFIDKGRQVNKIAIVPGGGTDPRLIQGAINLGCDTYFTGEYYNKLKIPYGDEERKTFNKLVGGFDINMVEGSHYSTERLVFVNELSKLFNNIGLSYQFIEQDDPWY